MSSPRVTVVIPTYDWAPVLPYSTGSVLDQTFDDFELLVIGDGCTDESAEVVGRIRDRRVRWIGLPRNSGSQVAPNNAGLGLARGRFVAYLGHDDLWLPRHLERLVHALETTNAELAFGRRLHVTAAGRDVLPPEGYVYEAGQWLPPTSAMHGRDVVRRLGGWRPPVETGALDPESDLWARIAATTGPPAIVDEITAVKLPAARRPGVYRARPHHEQQRWLERIRASADPATALRALAAEPWEPTDEERAIVASWPPEITGARATSAAERHRVRRAYKGLDD